MLNLFSLFITSTNWYRCAEGNYRRFSDATIGSVCSALFDEPAWTGPRYTGGPNHGEGSAAFRGAALAPTGKIVFAPNASANVGVFDTVTETYRSGPGHGGDGIRAGAVLAPTGEIIFSRLEAANIGVVPTGAQTHIPLVSALHPLVNNA
jgi:hypothetical protein